MLVGGMIYNSTPPRCTKRKARFSNTGTGFDGCCNMYDACRKYGKIYAGSVYKYR